MSHIEREQKFLVDLEHFDKVKLSTYKHIRQCYLSVEQDDALEVRVRSSYDTAKPPGQRLTYTQTIKRRRQDDAIARDEVEFAIAAEVFEQVWALSHWRLDKRRYAVDGWTIDVFTSGPLQGLAVAEVEFSEQHLNVAAFLKSTGAAWPRWLAYFAGDVVDLTHRRVNLVAAGIVPPGLGLLTALDDLKTTQRHRAVATAYAEQLRQREPYTSASLNRQGVVDLDKVAAKARQQSKTTSFLGLESQRVVKASQ